MVWIPFLSRLLGPFLVFAPTPTSLMIGKYPSDDPLCTSFIHATESFRYLGLVSSISMSFHISPRFLGCQWFESRLLGETTANKRLCTPTYFQYLALYGSPQDGVWFNYHTRKWVQQRYFPLFLTIVHSTVTVKNATRTLQNHYKYPDTLYVV